MKSKWKTQKGDEWAFENAEFKAHADRLPYHCECSDSAIVINGPYPKRKRVSNRSFLNFLHETSKEFIQHGIVLRFQGDSKQWFPYEPILRALTDKGYIKFKVSPVINSSFECVRNWVHQSNSVIEITVLNKKPGLLFL